MTFVRIKLILAAYDRGDFDVVGLMSRLDEYAERASRESKPPRKQTHVGPMPVLWGEP